MRLVVVSHKLVWESHSSPSRFATDGGFPLQMQAISELFEKTTLVVPCSDGNGGGGASSLNGKDLRVVPLSLPAGRGLARKLAMPAWLLKNGLSIWKEVRKSDAVHAPIPGDVGTIGMIFALVGRKPLFVRHCGNWFIQRTLAERFWKWSMEYFGGGRNVMLATGGAADPPSLRNENIEWIFSTSLRRKQIENNLPRELPDDKKIKLVIACRQEPRKGTDVVIKAMPAVLESFPNVSLDVVGDGSCLPEWRRLAESLGVSESIRFHGKVEHSKVLSIVREAHIFCFPTDASEGFPKAVLEALALGIPVITTRVSVLPELMKSGGGILLDEADAGKLATAIREMCTDNIKYRDRSKKAIETALQYSLECWQDRIGSILRKSWGVASLMESNGH